MLHGPEQRLLRRLSVFAGGWTLAAAETVCAGDNVKNSDVLDLLTLLCDKSLVVAEQTGGHSRYRLLETVRQYALEKLVESGEEWPVRELHRDFYLALAEEAKPKLIGAQQVGWLQRLDADHENLLAGLDWSLAEAGSQGGLRYCGALDLYWCARGHFAEGLQWCVRMLDKAGGDTRTRERAKALDAAGHMAFYLGDYPANRAWREEGLAIMRGFGDRRGIAQLQVGLGNLDCVQGDFSSARARDEESLAIMRDLGDQRGIARSLHRLGSVALFQADFLAARMLLDESLSIARNLGDRVLVAYIQNFLGSLALFQNDLLAARTMFEANLANSRDVGDDIGTAQALGGLGQVALRQSDYLAARSLHHRSLEMGRAHGDRLAIAYGLEAMAEVVAALGNAPRAARIYGAAQQLRMDLGSPLPPAWQPTYDRSVAATRSALGDDAAFNHAWQGGGALTLDQAMDLALEATAN